MPFRLFPSCCPPSTGLRYPWGGWVYLEDLPPDHAMVKVDVSKAFNSIRRDRVLRAVEEYIPSLLPLAHSSYSSPSVLMWYDTQILSAKGIQQGDPLGHMLFCLGIHKLISPLSSDFNVFYLDDGTIGGKVEDLQVDLQLIGLFLNVDKSELTSHSNSKVRHREQNFWDTDDAIVIAIGLRVGVPICLPIHLTCVENLPTNLDVMA